MKEESIVGKIIIKGKLRLESPLIIGGGKNEFVDIEVLKDRNGTPFIPATSVIGVLRHYFNDNFPEKKGDQFDYFWGISEKIDPDKLKSIQSTFICHDLNSSETKISVRDGVRIDPGKQIAEDEGKYDFEIIEKGAEFDLFWEVTLRQIHDKDTFKQILGTMIEALKSGISIGAKTNNGFGKCKLNDVKILEFDFSKKDDVSEWLRQDFSSGKTSSDFIPYKKNNNVFSVDATFAVKNSIIVRAYSEKIDMPDAASITSNGEFILPGTSIKGAIRNRASKILKTLVKEGDNQKIEQKINHLFGTAGKNNDNEKIKSRVLIEEREIKGVKPELQTRIKIDRFTGGTVKSALFDTMPLWSSGEQDRSVNINIYIRDYKEWEAGLILHVLKDLWCEDLPIGGEKNVGRGVLKGIYACIKWKDSKGKDKKIEIRSDGKGGISSGESNVSELNNFSNNLKEEVRLWK
ncbi:MAG: RAMP superfamily CRISPR-associated protein [Candidatus Methanoperedens sp.]|nr:RAMP superfamily CRISPR-associated protein [Candidatus Methanoperedens sp.]